MFTLWDLLQMIELTFLRNSRILQLQAARKGLRQVVFTHLTMCSRLRMWSHLSTWLLKRMMETKIRDKRMTRVTNKQITRAAILAKLTLEMLRLPRNLVKMGPHTWVLVANERQQHLKKDQSKTQTIPLLPTVKTKATMRGIWTTPYPWCPTQKAPSLTAPWPQLERLITSQARTIPF